MILGVNLPRLLVLWQHWQSKTQRINFVLALLWIGITVTFCEVAFLLAPKHVFVGCQLCWIIFSVEKNLGYLRWSKLLGAFEPTQTCWKLMNRWWHPIQPWRKRRKNSDVRKIGARNVHRSLGWAPLSYCRKLPGTTVKNVDVGAWEGDHTRKTPIGAADCCIESRWPMSLRMLRRWPSGETLLHLKHLAKHTKGVI